MGIIQDDRFDAPRPEVSVTRYGAEYVTAATETPVSVDADVESGKASEPAVVEKKRAGRPRKNAKK